jgi:hypothetical protein
LYDHELILVDIMEEVIQISALISMYILGLFLFDE